MAWLTLDTLAVAAFLVLSYQAAPMLLVGAVWLGALAFWLAGGPARLFPPRG